MEKKHFFMGQKLNFLPNVLLKEATSTFPGHKSVCLYVRVFATCLPVCKPVSLPASLPACLSN
jgi:hypothetical protein